jgi:hypothetical protein
MQWDLYQSMNDINLKFYSNKVKDSKFFLTSVYLKPLPRYLKLESTGSTELRSLLPAPQPRTSKNKLFGFDIFAGEVGSGKIVVCVCVPNLGFRFSTLAFDPMNVSIGEQSVIDEQSHAGTERDRVVTPQQPSHLMSTCLRIGALQPHSYALHLDQLLHIQSSGD